MARVNALISILLAMSIKWRRTTLSIYVALILASVLSAFFLLGVDTDSSKMLSPELAFQQKTRKLNDNFPTLKNSLILVVRSPIADAADEVARHIATKLETSPHFDQVFSASSAPFFRQNGLLYKDVETLERELDQLNKSASLLASLRQTPSFDNFFHALYTAERLAEGAEFDVTFLDAFYHDLNRTLKARLEGEERPLSWSDIGGKPQNESVSLPKSARSNEESDLAQRLVYAMPRLDFSALQPAKKALIDIENTLSTLDDSLKSLTTVGVTGDPALRHDELRSVSDGIELSLFLSLIFVGLLLLIALRNFRAVIVVLIGLLTALLLTTGLAAVIFGKLNLVSVAFVVLLVGLGLDFSIHAMAYLVYERKGTVLGSLSAMGTAIGGALALSAFTTMLAFLSFVPTDFHGIAQLGVLGAVGVFIAFLVSITLVPALVASAPKVLMSARLHGKTARPEGFLGPFAARLQSFRPMLTLALITLFFLSLFLISDVRFDADPIALRNPESSSMRTLALLNDAVETTPYRLSLVKPTLEDATAAANQLSGLSEVHQTRILTDFVPENQPEKLDIIDLAIGTFDTIVHGEGLENVTLPDGQNSMQALEAQLKGEIERPIAVDFAKMLNAVEAAIDTNGSPLKMAIERDIFRFFPALIESIKAQLSVKAVTLDNLPEFFEQRFVGQDGQWRVDIVPANDLTNPAELQKFVKAVEALDETIAGAPLQIVNAGKIVSKAMSTAVLLAAVSVVLVGMIMLRKVNLVIAIVAPLIVAAVLTGAASVVFDIPFNYANIIVFPLLIGLGIDSAIHVALRREGMRSSQTLDQSSTPWAVLFSGLTTIAAFVTLGLSDHRGTASMGQMLAISVVFTLLSTIIMTPFIADLMDKNKDERTS